MKPFRIATFAFTIVLVVWAATPCRADDVYVIDFFAAGSFLPDSCTQLLWDSDTVFYNVGSASAAVTLLGVSNGGTSGIVPTAFSVDAGRATSIRQQVGLMWQPRSTTGLWVYHLSVPSSILVDSELLPSVTNASCSVPVVVLQPFGKTRLPVFRALVPAGQAQILAGLTVGDLPSRINVAVYNGGVGTASVTIGIMRACDGSLLDSRLATLPPNTVEQFGGFLGVGDGSGNCAHGLNRLAYAIVTVDQPSVSFASIVANGQTPVSSIQVSGSEP